MVVSVETIIILYKVAKFKILYMYWGSSVISKPHEGKAVEMPFSCFMAMRFIKKLC